MGKQTFAEFVTTALQHNLVRQGRFRGLLLCAAIETQQAATAEVPTVRRVYKLLCEQSLFVLLQTKSANFMLDLILASIG